MNYLGIDYPNIYKEMSEKYRYYYVFMTPPWEEIYHTDNERYESFEQSLVIHNHLKKTYLELDYFILDIPRGNIKERIQFILNSINE
jgi:predicted ATPase